MFYSPVIDHLWCFVFALVILYNDSVLVCIFVVMISYSAQDYLFVYTRFIIDYLLFFLTHACSCCDNGTAT